MPARGLLDILPGKLFCIYIGNLRTKHVSLPSLMIVAYVSNARACIIHAKDDEPHISKDEDPILTQPEKFSSNPTVNFVHYKPPDFLDEQMNRHNAIERSDEVSKTEWLEDLTLLEGIPLIATNLLTCLNSLRPCRTDKLVR